LAVALAIFAPHRVYYSRESVIELQTKTAEEVARALKGEPPRSPVNPEVLGSRELLTLRLWSMCYFYALTANLPQC
jgi:hypothetical protein